MDAEGTIFKQIQDLRTTWRALWWAMAKGQKSEYDRIKATPVMEFYGVFDLWKTQRDQELEALRQRQRKK